MDAPRRIPLLRDMARAHEFGRHCEDLAVAHLLRGGWQIVERNYRFGHREIDVIARRGSLVIFVEVKGRRGHAWGHPLEAINARKRLEIQRVAAQWVARFGQSGQTYRFDAIAVTGSGEQATLAHTEDAWRL
jgi:putative endonuclease